MRIEYVRVSKEEQSKALQMDALDKIFHEKVSGVYKIRPEYEKLKEILRVEDELLVWDID